MKTIEQIQEENRKLIILANNPEAKSYEEALQKELGFGCSVFVYDYAEKNGMKISYERVYKDRYNYDRIDLEEDGDYQIKKIIGKPLDLSRVLIALNEVIEKSKWVEFMDLHNIFDQVASFQMTQGNGALDFQWDLTKPTLEEQTKESQRIINKLLTNND